MNISDSNDNKIHLSFPEARALAEDVFLANNCSESVAKVLADVILLCERDGPASHGFFSMYNYMFGLRGGHVNGRGEPKLERVRPGVLRVDGDNGYGQVAMRRFRGELIEATREAGIATMALRNAHNIGPLRHD